MMINEILRIWTTVDVVLEAAKARGLTPDRR